MDSVVLAVVCVVTAIVGLAVARMTRHITFYATDTDNEILAKAAARAGEWRWPSDMHKYGNGKTRMKDGTVLGLAAIQRVLRDRTGDYPLVVLCLAVNAASAILVFLIASTYWSTGVGLLVWGLLVTSLWPYQLALFGCHICVAQTFFLASVYLMQQAASNLGPLQLALYLASGVAIGLMLFSSASSRKYLPLLAGAFIYSQLQALSVPSPTSWVDTFLSRSMGIPIICLIIALLLSAASIRISYRRIVTAMCFGRAPGWMNRMILVRDSEASTLQHYLARASEFAHLAIKLCLAIAVYLVVSLAFASSSSFYWSQLSLLLGVWVVVLLLTYPNVLANLRGYYGYSEHWKRPRFPIYRRYFASIGKPIKDHMRGAGFPWVVRYFTRMAPVHCIFYSVCLLLLTTLLIFKGAWPGEAWGTGAIVILSASPVLMGEITHGVQVGRSYYPGLIGLLVLIAYVAFQIDQSLPPPARAVFWSVSAGLVLVSASWTFWIFLDDVWPARMAPAWLGQTLRTLGVKELNTYDTPYNAAFVNALPPAVLARYRINFINTLSEAKEGYVVVPGTSAKAFNMEGQRCAIEHGDFDSDPELNRMLESKAIEKYAVASFKTFGTSRIWVHEAEVTSYRDLILREIGDDDRWRGRGWVLDASKLHAGRQQETGATTACSRLGNNTP